MKKNKHHYRTKILFLLFCCFSAFITQSCHNKNTSNTTSAINFILYQDSCSLNSAESNGIWSYRACEMKDSNANNYFSRTDKNSPYGVSYKSRFNKNVLNKNIKIVIEAKVRMSDKSNKASFGISINFKDSMLHWLGIDIAKHISDNNKWILISDTVQLPRSIVDSTNTITIFLWNVDGKGTVDADDIHIKFIQNKMPTFLPEINPTENIAIKGEQLFKNNFYSLFYDKNSGTISLCNSNGDKLINSFIYHLQYKMNQRDTSIRKFSNAHFAYTSQKNNSFYFEIKSEATTVVLAIQAKMNHEIVFTTETTYNKDIAIVRESVIANYVKEIKEVYKKNRQLDTSNFQEEYWLANEGFRIGEESNSLIAYHLPQISSLQLSTQKKQVFFNLDYNFDHLRMVFPLMIDSAIKNVKIDVSCNSYSKGEIATRGFSLFIGSKPIAIARFMKNPFGYLSTFIFTEHADFSDIKTQRAITYGAEYITKYEDAIGGFAKYKIPLTKSVFYCNPQKINNHTFNAKFNTEICTIKSNPDFYTLLKELNANGSDICLHTPEEYTTNEQTLKEALAFLKLHFSSVTWIDHGYDNSLKNNREDIVCDAFNTSSKYYVQSLFKNNQVKYFWNCYNEESALLGKYYFDNAIREPYYGYGDFAPLPDYCTHFVNHENVITWQASSLLQPKDAGTWSYYFNKNRFQDFINNYQVYIGHCYPARVDSSTGFYDRNEKNKFVINPNFNKLLRTLSEYKKSGNINVTTIRDFLNYNTSIENIDYKIIDTKNIHLTNKNKFVIRGLTLITNANKVIVNGNTVNQKKDGNNIIFWFDLKAESDATIAFGK